MADKTPEQEPSIEEILASIRQIISDDDEKEPEEAPVAFTPAPEPEPEPEPVFVPEPIVADEPEEEVLELNTPAPDEPVEIEEKVMEIDLQDLAEEEPVPPEEPPMPQPSAPATAEDLLTDAARSATIASMAKLAGNMPITRHREYGNITLEDLVREMLHPMLKEWVSDNLPGMVERLVQKELEKLARKAQDV